MTPNEDDWADPAIAAAFTDVTPPIVDRPHETDPPSPTADGVHVAGDGRRQSTTREDVSIANPWTCAPATQDVSPTRRHSTVTLSSGFAYNVLVVPEACQPGVTPFNQT
jgi:hypothetical protein